MGELKLKGMTLVKELDTEEEFDALRDFLLTDPKDITHSINFWKGEINNAGISDGEKSEIEEIIKNLKNHLKNQARITCSVYAVKSSEEKVEPKVENSKKSDPSKENLRIVKDDENQSQNVKTLREKYKEFIKTINFDGLRLKVTQMMSSKETENEAIEFATFMLSEGLYQAKNAKKWAQENIDTLLEAWKTSANKLKTETTNADETPAEDEDLFKKYERYLGDNGITLTGLKTEIKFLLNEGKIEEAIEIATFLLSQGEYIDSKPVKWSNADIEKFIIDIKEDLKNNPLDLKPEGSTDIDPNIDTNGGINTEDIIKHDLKIVEFINEVGNKILTTNISEEDIKKYVFEQVKEKNIENLDMFYNVDSTAEELESMYVTFFIAFVTEKFKEKEFMKLDVKEEITKLIKIAIEKDEKALSTVIQSAMMLYRKRGEQVRIKEAKTLVHSICEENYPEYYAEMMKILGEKKKDEPLTIVKDTKDFSIEHPEIWETVKDAKCLDDVYTMARELEKTQSFLVVTEMIIHLISSGKINDKEGDPVKWGAPEIELWINSQFTNAPTVNETEESENTNEESNEEKTVETTETKSETSEETETLEITTPEKTTTETETPETSGEEETAGTNPDTDVQQETQTTPAPITIENVGDAQSQENGTEEKLEPVSTEINYPNDIVIPPEDESLKELYGHKKQDFWQGLHNIIGRLTTEGKSKKEITHILADKMMTLSRNKDLSQCFVRNWKREPVLQLYKVINKIACTLEIPGWELE